MSSEKVTPELAFLGVAGIATVVTIYNCYKAKMEDQRIEEKTKKREEQRFKKKDLKSKAKKEKAKAVVAVKQTIDIKRDLQEVKDQI